MSPVKNKRKCIKLSIVIFASIVSFAVWGKEEPGKPDVNYIVEVDPGLQELSVRVCFNIAPPEKLVAASRYARRYLKNAGIGHDSIIDISGVTRSIPLHEAAQEACPEYTVDLNSAAHHNRRRRSRVNLSRDNLVAGISSWLWLPHEVGQDADIQITFKYPPGFSVSTPWRLLDRAPESATYRYVATPPGWRAYSAFGRFELNELTIPGATIRLAVLNATPAVNTEEVRDWIEHGAMALTKTYGRFPLPSPQVLVIPAGRSRGSPVPWGQVLRGGGTASYLIIDQTRTPAELKADWTLTHELSHMLHPYLGNAGSWLAEGLASYYQNVLQARTGTLSEERAWEKLHEGFQRGIDQTRAGTTLDEAGSGRGRQTTMRVYWSGAAIALLADLALRDNGMSLDHALSEFQTCCLPTSRLWAPLEFMQKLDALTGLEIFTGLYHEYVHSDRFPELGDAYSKLGMEAVNGELTFQDTGSAVILRNAIMTAREP